jgi:hypothetical protein
MTRSKRKHVKNSQRKGNIGHFAYVAFSKALPQRAATVARHTSVLNSVFKKLFSDENFRTLMRAESVTAVPACLNYSLEKGGSHAVADRSGKRR